MSSDRHPPSHVLFDHVSGALPLAPGLVVGAHLESCLECRTSVLALEIAAGEELTALSDAALPDGLLDETLAALSRPSPTAGGRAAPIEQIESGCPAAVAALGLRRRRWLGPGYWLAHVRLPRNDSWRAFVLRAPAGGALPGHGHGGEEFICVLEGAYSDGETTYRRGDFAHAGEDIQHVLQASDEGPCLCLVATSAPIRWRGAARLLRAVADI